MRIDYFRYLFKNEYDVFWINKDLALHKKPYNLTDYKTGKSVDFRSVDEMLMYEYNGETIWEIILGLENPYMPELDGGRGAGSGSDSFKGGFGHASDGSGSDSGGSYLPPAIANTKVKAKTLEGALAEFKRNHLLSNREFAYEVDGDGYVHQYVRGAAHSVAIASNAKVRKGDRTMIIHNHPSGSAFSDADLISTAADRRSKGIIASGKNYDYKLEKGNHFNAQAFTRAVKTAKLSGKDYNDAADKWLKKNQKKYGYTYTRTKN